VTYWNEESVSWATEVRLPVGVRDFYFATALELTHGLNCPSSGYAGGKGLFTGERG
jgi:hypothetical protein